MDYLTLVDIINKINELTKYMNGTDSVLRLGISDEGHYIVIDYQDCGWPHDWRVALCDYNRKIIVKGTADTAFGACQMFINNLAIKCNFTNAMVF